MSYELKTNTAYRIPVGPLVDPTDGKTAETELDVTALSVQIYQMKNDGSAVVRTQFAPTASGGDNDMVLVTSSTDAMYDLELTAAQLNWLGNGRISFYDVDGFLVHYFDIHVVSANYFDNKYGATIEDVNTKTITNGIIVGATLGADCITSAKIADDAIGPEHIGAGAIVAATLGADCITNAKIADNAIAVENIKDAAITAAKLAGDCITAAKIAAAAIDNATFAADVGSTAYADNIIALAVRKVLDELNLDHLMKVAVNDRDALAEVVDDTVLANLMTKTDGDTSDFDHATDSLEAIKDKAAAIKVITDALTAAAAAKLALSAGVIVPGTVSWDETNASTTVFYSDDITEATADHYIGRIVIFTSGDLIYQATDITDYALVATEGKFTVTALTEAPADNVTFIIV